jgi:hypothetical protein
VEISERYADGQADSRELQLSRANSLNSRKPGDSHQEEAANGSGLPGAFEAAVTAATSAAAAAADDVIYSNPELHRQPNEYQSTWGAGQSAEQYQQCQLLREIVGDPYRSHLLDFVGQTPTVTTLARGIYDEAAFDRLPILADALEEAGRADQDILRHCRRQGEHVRGCWVVDTLLGQE